MKTQNKKLGCWWVNFRLYKQQSAQEREAIKWVKQNVEKYTSLSELKTDLTYFLRDKGYKWTVKLELKKVMFHRVPGPNFDIFYVIKNRKYCIRISKFIKDGTS